MLSNVMHTNRQSLVYHICLSLMAFSECLPRHELRHERSNKFPPGTDQLSWQAWLLIDDKYQQSQQHGNGDSLNAMLRSGYVSESLVRKRITPKSVFIAPTFSPEAFPECADGYKADAMGRCIKVIKINEAAHLEFLLQKLNEQFADYEEEEEEEDEEVNEEVVLVQGQPVPVVTEHRTLLTRTTTSVSGPFQLHIPLELPQPDDADPTPEPSTTIEPSTDPTPYNPTPLIIVTPKIVSFPAAYQKAANSSNNADAMMSLSDASSTLGGSTKNLNFSLTNYTTQEVAEILGVNPSDVETKAIGVPKQLIADVDESTEHTSTTIINATLATVNQPSTFDDHQSAFPTTNTIPMDTTTATITTINDSTASFIETKESQSTESDTEATMRLYTSKIDNDDAVTTDAADDMLYFQLTES